MEQEEKRREFEDQEAETVGGTERTVKLTADDLQKIAGGAIPISVDGQITDSVTQA